jgi:hypothetical protein
MFGGAKSVSSFNDAVKQMHADNMGTIEKLFWHDDIGRVRFIFSSRFVYVRSG